MTCEEAERLVMPYINGSITDEELEGFLKHIEHCPECREELEIYFTVDVGIRQLDEGTGTYNIKGALRRPWSCPDRGFTRWNCFARLYMR